MSVAARGETASGVRFLSGVVTRRWIILVIGVGAGLLTGLIAAFAAPTHYAAETSFAIENPAPKGGPTEAKAATDQVAELMPTIAQLAVSDDVLKKVIDEAVPNESVSSLRSHVSTSIPFQSLTVVVRIELGKARDSDAAMKAFKTRFTERVSHMWGSGTFVAIPIQEKAAAKVGRSLLAVVLVATIIGLALAVVVAFVLDTV